MFYDYEEDRVATPAEAMHEYAYNVGEYDRYKDSQWILTDYDVWVINPHYRGRPQPHPEETCYMTEEEVQYWVDRAVAKSEFVGPPRPSARQLDDDIPF